MSCTQSQQNLITERSSTLALNQNKLKQGKVFDDAYLIHTVLGEKTTSEEAYFAQKLLGHNNKTIVEGKIFQPYHFLKYFSASFTLVVLLYLLSNAFFLD